MEASLSKTTRKLLPPTGLTKGDRQIGKLRQRRSTRIRTLTQAEVVLRPGLRGPRPTQNLQLNCLGIRSPRVIPLLFLDPERRL